MKEIFKVGILILIFAISLFSAGYAFAQLAGNITLEEGLKDKEIDYSVLANPLLDYRTPGFKEAPIIKDEPTEYAKELSKYALMLDTCKK